MLVGYLPMFLLALTAGLRQCELIALKWSDLDVKERTLTITEKRSVERRELVEYEGGTRIVSLTPEVVELLRLEHAKHPRSPLVFMHPATQRPYSPQMVRRLHNEIIQEAGLDHIRFADLRHTCAVLSLQNGMDMKEVSQMLGHFRTAMTRQNYVPYLACPAAKDENRHTEASREELRQAADILDRLLKF
ncbi:site-specific integrase [Pseudoflavonifractor phocaeensis]|uniref:tyrosine-type recombinase/integrase n=1 Tax=Pseudoflavonifractor phocaeensis TaxID=1870988 RepID=UPI0025A4B868|nr:site-specific integrase [Pseudoflavonifractor phocaeensis]MDM8237597.1 site-specific integrase [Pseudoflavonifractor phocaeensis]